MRLQWILSVCLFLLVTVANNGVRANDLDDVLLDKPIDLQMFRLDSTLGKPLDAAYLANKWTFVALGYTTCPDVCPFMLGNLAAVEAEIAAAHPQVSLPGVVFISVDPERDDLETLTEYVRHFSASFVGATGSRVAIDDFMKTVGAFYRLGRKDKDGDYLVDHSALIYLIDPKARIAAKFEPPLDPKKTNALFQEIQARFAAQTKS